MIAELIIPIEELRGMLRKDGYYFRMYKGKQIVQRCPNRSGHVKTDSEKANQERFIAIYGKRRLPNDGEKPKTATRRKRDRKTAENDY